MTSREQRDANTVAARAMLTELVELGVKQEGWTRVETKHPCEPATGGPPAQTVLTKDGTPFYIRAGYWGGEDKLTIDLASIREGALEISPPGDRLQASASYTRGAVAILKDFKRRVIDRPETKAAATRMWSQLQEQVSGRERLLRNVEKISALGYEFRELNARDTYDASAYRKSFGPEFDWKPRIVRVNREGVVKTDIECTVDQFAQVLDILSK